MSLFAIGDLHLSFTTKKPMDIFTGWDNHTHQLQDNWNEIVQNEDLVVIPGDISWAMNLKSAYEDFEFIHKLPGKKIILKGNHDYWWTSKKKIRDFLCESGFTSISILQNDCMFYTSDIAVCGTRSWLFEDKEAFDQKLVLREAGRLRASLEAAGNAQKIVFLHYPPIYRDERSELILSLLCEYNVKRCYYAHLHGNTIYNAFCGTQNGTSYGLVSADALQFCPYKIL